MWTALCYADQTRWQHADIAAIMAMCVGGAPTSTLPIDGVDRREGDELAHRPAIGAPGGTIGEIGVASRFSRSEARGVQIHLRAVASTFAGAAFRFKTLWPLPIFF
jgi:hypothetical protein